MLTCHELNEVSCVSANKINLIFFFFLKLDCLPTETLVQSAELRREPVILSVCSCVQWASRQSAVSQPLPSSFSLASENSRFTSCSSSGCISTSRAVMARALAVRRVKNWALSSPAEARTSVHICTSDHVCTGPTANRVDKQTLTVKRSCFLVYSWYLVVLYQYTVGMHAPRLLAVCGMIKKKEIKIKSLKGN